MSRKEKKLGLVLANAPQGRNFSFFLPNALQGNIWPFLTNAPQMKILGENDPRFLGSLLY
jgi:hypothetical protein